MACWCASNISSFFDWWDLPIHLLPTSLVIRVGPIWHVIYARPLAIGCNLRAHLSLPLWAADWRMNHMIMVNVDDACYPIIPSYVVGFYWQCSKEPCGRLRWPNFPFGKEKCCGSLKTGPPTNYLPLYIIDIIFYNINKKN